MVREAGGAHRPDRPIPSVLIGPATRGAIALLRETADRWAGDRCYRLGASLAYYAIFSLLPLLLLSVTILGYALGAGDSVRMDVLDSLKGATGSTAVRSLLDDALADLQAHRTARGVGAIVGLATLLFGASGVFSELFASLNTIWRVRPRPVRGAWNSVVRFVADKALSFALVVAAGLVLLGSLVLSTALATIAGRTGGHLPWRGAEIAASMLLVTGALAATFRNLPQTHVEWRDVLGGALLAAAMLTVLKHLLAWYLASMGSYAAYGAVGAVLGLLLLIYASSLVMFFGAEFTRVYAERYGSLRHHPA